MDKPKVFTPFEPFQSKVLTREEFLQQYVLNRALTIRGNFDGPDAVRLAIESYNAIEAEVNKNEQRH